MFKNIWIIVKKELNIYFNTSIAYIFLALFLIVGNWLFWQNFYLFNQASMRSYFSLLPWIFLLIIPAITMRIWSEEKKSGTIELLLTLPIKDIEIVLGKFLSGMIFIFIALALTLISPIIIASFGNLDWGAVIGGYLGALFLGGAYLALGLFISSINKNQITSFIISLTLCFLFMIMGSEFILIGLPQFLASIMKWSSVTYHFNSISRGVIDFRDIFYYLSFIFIFLLLNINALQSRHWKD
jgi:ABC-2 type transport system permease protein